VEELKDLNQQFEDRHARAHEFYRRGEFAAAIDEWKIALTLCAGRPIQEQSVLTGIVEASVRLSEYEEAVRLLSELARSKKERGLNVPSGLIERIEYLKSLQRTFAKPSRTASKPSRTSRKSSGKGRQSR